MNSTACCPNTDYCIINSTSWEVKCCALGSTCGGVCDTQHYPTNITTTTTISSSVTVETVLACVGRTCSSTNYVCPSSMGGGCCPYGSNCGYDSVSSRGICLATASSSSTTATATTTATPTGGGGVIVEHQSHGLSTGAKAGIAVGVIAGAALLIGALTWMCLRRRRSTRTTTTTAQELDTNPDRGAAAGGGTIAGPAVPPPSNDGGARPYRADSYGPHMSEVDGYSYSAGYAPSSSHGGDGRLTSGADYFGPTGEAYYTQAQQHQRTASPEHSSVGGGGGGGPVEIGGRTNSVARRAGDQNWAPHHHHGAAAAHSIMSSRHDSDGASQSELADTSSAQLARGGSLARRHEAPAGGGVGGGVRESIAGRFELHGGDVLPSPSPGAGTASEGGEVYHDAPEGRLAGAGVGAIAGAGGSGFLPQPLPTPGSEMSEFATPSPMSRDEPEQLPRREV